MGDQYIRSVTDFKIRNLIHKSNIKSKNKICGTSRCFNNKQADNNSLHLFLQMQLTESIENDLNMEGIL